MSGLAVSVILGSLPSFLIFWFASVCGRQSATAAVHTATSTGSTDSHAASISRAVSTRSSFTRGGGAMATGPDTRMVSAPAWERVRYGIALAAGRTVGD